MNDYDFYLRHASVHDGDYVGFALAFAQRLGLSHIPGQFTPPRIFIRPWILDNTNPHDPSLGAWGIREWKMRILLADALTNAVGQPPADGRGAASQRDDLRAFMDLPALELKDVDGVSYTVKMMGYYEEHIEQVDTVAQDGGFLALCDFIETTA